MENGGSPVVFLFPAFCAQKKRRAPDDPFFRNGDEERELLAKQAALELSSEEVSQLGEAGPSAFGQGWTCPFAGCSVHLDGPAAYDRHYFSAHLNSCRVCARTFPTTRLLSIHVSESHDAFFQAKAARGFPMYECLVEACGSKFHDAVARQQHLRDRHHFPATFSFHHGPQEKRPNLTKRKEKATGGSSVVGKKNELERNALEGRHEKVRSAEVDCGPVRANSQGQGDTSDSKAGGDKESVVSKQASGNAMDVDSLSVGISRLRTDEGQTFRLPENVAFGRRRGHIFDNSGLLAQQNKHRNPN